uniref:Hist_deacetyl domain-containing protein n=1 Tax=Heterorhabditis bacteriophora TaxID=37862 RepID=A0A1I7XP56_HETBA
MVIFMCNAITVVSSADFVYVLNIPVFVDMNANAGTSTNAEYVSLNIDLTKEIDTDLASRLFIRISGHQCPVVFHEHYDVSFFGLEKCHPFDSGKWGRIFRYLEGWGLLSSESIIKPNEATKDDLMIAHSKKIISIEEFELLLLSTQQIYVILLFEGNGHETDFAEDARVFILDMFNPSIYPKDRKSQSTIRRPIEVGRRTTDEEYLRLLRHNLDNALSEFSADILVYNAGTDCLQGDPLGGMSLTENGVISRDEVVFRVAGTHSTPVVMVLSGGYQRDNARVIANSIRNLHDKELIQLLS